MPIFRGIRNQEGKFQSPVTIEGGVRGAFKEISEQARREQEVVDYINNRVQDPKFKDMWKHMVRHQFYDNKMQQAAKNNDEFDYKHRKQQILQLQKKRMMKFKKRYQKFLVILEKEKIQHYKIENI